MTKALIKKSLRAYITRRQLIFLILPDGKVVGVFLFQCVKEQVNCIFETLVILPDFHRVYHFYQSGEILLICGSLIINVADQCRIQQSLGFDPKIVSRFSFSFGIRNQHRYQFQNIFLIVYVRKRVVVHTF